MKDVLKMVRVVLCMGVVLVGNPDEVHKLEGELDKGVVGEGVVFGDTEDWDTGVCLEIEVGCVGGLGVEGDDECAIDVIGECGVVDVLEVLVQIVFGE